MPNESIYDGTRVAQPDEVWNFQRGDGLERAIALANAWRSRHPESSVALASDGKAVVLKLDDRELRFESGKGLEKRITL
jgi:hypothetical protein